MAGMTVSELARRSGVPATTVRFYEREELLAARRAGNGYRLYDEGDVERLAFIATAKGLGLPLDEVKRLLEPWAHGLCRDVQGELAPMLDARIADTHERIEELRRFASRLAVARERLRSTVREGPCEPSCAFLGSGAGPETPRPRVMGTPEPAIACSLDDGERAEQRRRWRTVLAGAISVRATEDGARVVFDGASTSVGDLAEVAAAEARCCPSLGLTLDLGAEPYLRLRAPTGALDLVDELLGITR